jgi:hypothetical protein
MRQGESMFELRWVSKAINIPLDDGKFGPMITQEKIIKTLQFRTGKMVDAERGSQRELWTEWEDVPTEESK